MKPEIVKLEKNGDVKQVFANTFAFFELKKRGYSVLSERKIDVNSSAKSEKTKKKSKKSKKDGENS